jgi:integrase/recombinase XerD
VFSASSLTEKGHRMRKRQSVKLTSVRDAALIFIDSRSGQALSPSTIRFEKTALNVLVTAFAERGVGAVTKADIVQLLEERRKAGNTTNTIRHFVTVYRRFYAFLVRHGLTDENPASGVPMPKAEQKPIEPMSRDQVQALLSVLNTTRFSGLRNKTIMMLLYDTGMRVGEALGIRLVDVELPQRRIAVYGKGRKARTVYLSETMTATLRSYLHRRGVIDGNPYLFPDEYGTGALEYSSFYHAMLRASKKTTVQGIRMSPHTLRHSFAREWTLAGGDVASLSAQLGHSDLQVTSRYVHLLGDDRAAVQQRVSPLERLGGATAKKKRL